MISKVSLREGRVIQGGEEGSQVKNGMKYLLGKGNSMCKAVMEKVIIMKAH